MILVVELLMHINDYMDEGEPEKRKEKTQH